LVYDYLSSIEVVAREGKNLWHYGY
jgi:hypothetical protein